jgi:outer membrane receptor protein involved in Fe transport
LGSFKTDGVDLQFSWAPELSSFGIDSGASVFLDSYIGYANSFEIVTVPGSAAQDYNNTIAVGASHPEWKAMTTLGYRGDELTVGLRWRYLGAMDDVTSVTTPAAPLPGTPSYSTYDLFGSYELTENLQIRAGVTNFTDELSVRVSSSQNSTDTSVYNAVGRSWYLGMSFSM